MVNEFEPFMGEDDDRFLPIIPFLPFCCPKCGSDKPRTHAVRRDPDAPTERSHVCSNCGQKYRSIEIRRGELGRWIEEHGG